MGAGDVPVLEPWHGLPALANGPTILDGQPPPEAAPRGDTTPNSTELPVMWKQVGGRWQLTHPGVGVIGNLTESGMRQIAAELGIPTARAAVPAQLQQPISEDNSVGVLSDIYDVVDSGLGGVLPGGVPFGSGVPTPAGVAYQTLVNPAPAPAPAPVAAPVSQGTAPGPDYHYIHTCAKGWHWAKKRSRRRKRLATQSDIADIASLMGAFNIKGAQTQAFNTYLATHSR